MLRAAWFIKLSYAYTVAVSEVKIKKRQLSDPSQGKDLLPPRCHWPCFVPITNKYVILLTKQGCVAVMLWICISDVLGLNLGWNTVCIDQDFSRFSHSLQANLPERCIVSVAAIYFQILSNSLFTSHPVSGHYTV
jgi:hypothetical protein